MMMLDDLTLDNLLKYQFSFILQFVKQMMQLKRIKQNRLRPICETNDAIEANKNKIVYVQLPSL
jgi:hypothetical protein